MPRQGQAPPASALATSLLLLTLAQSHVPGLGWAGVGQALPSPCTLLSGHHVLLPKGSFMRVLMFHHLMAKVLVD